MSQVLAGRALSVDLDDTSVMARSGKGQRARTVERLAVALFLGSIAAAATSCARPAVLAAGALVFASGLVAALRVGMGCYEGGWFIDRHRIRSAIAVSLASLVTGLALVLLMLIVTASVAYLRCPHKPNFGFPG
jgi:hypothetical protein